MSQLYAIKLRFTSPLHIHRDREDYGSSVQILHSDTIYSALIQTMASLYTDELPENAVQWTDQLGFSVSSGCPFYGKDNGEDVFFFSKPFAGLEFKGDETNTLAKKAKDVKWVDQPSFESIINREEFDNSENVESYMQGDFFSGTDLANGFMNNEDSPRVAVPNQEGEDASPFYMERIHFQEGSGLYFLISFDDDSWYKRVITALYALQDTGLGTDKHVGFGQFKFDHREDVQEFSLRVPESEYAITLGLYCPENHDQLLQRLDDENVAYELMKRGGWVTDFSHNSLRKSSVHMFTEGSVFKWDQQIDKPVISGAVKDVTPNVPHHPVPHTVVRIGKTIFCPAKMN